MIIFNSLNKRCCDRHHIPSPRLWNHASKNVCHVISARVFAINFSFFKRNIPPLITVFGKIAVQICRTSMSYDRSCSLWFFVLHFVVIQCQLPNLQPSDLAPSFALQTLNGRIVYRKSNTSSKRPTHPVIFHLFTRRSAFLQALWCNDTSLEEFIELSPGNTHYVFMSAADSKAVEDVLWMRSRLHRAIEKYYKRCV